MKQYFLLVLFFVVIIFPTSNPVRSTLNGLSYSFKQGDSMEYVVNSFHNFTLKNFPVNFENQTVYFKAGTQFKIVVQSVNSTNIQLALNYNNLTTTNLSQSFLSLFNFAHVSSPSSSDFPNVNDGYWKYQLSGTLYTREHNVQDTAYDQYFNSTDIKESWYWKTGWEESYYIYVSDFWMNGHQIVTFADLTMQISLLNPPATSTPGFEFFSPFVFAIPFIFRSQRRKDRK